MNKIHINIMIHPAISKIKIYLLNNNDWMSFLYKLKNQ